MENDDTEVGRLLTRREVLALIGLSGAALLAGSSKGGNDAGTPLPACVVRPQQTLGPYFVDEELHRSDIREDPSTGKMKPGVPLLLAFNVSRIIDGACTPLSGAQVDVWQCDASGIYSDVIDPRFNTVGQKFLRGYQLTDASGRARFTTIYPGWYRGRTVHIHFKIRTNPSHATDYEFVSQLYFDDALTDRVHSNEPYANEGPRTMRNSHDWIFRRGGRQLVLAAVESGQGYTATFDIGLRTA